MTEMYRFKTRNFIVRAIIVPDRDADTSFDETGETAARIASGEWQAFGTIVTVAYRGVVLGESSLWGSISGNPADFFREHLGANGCAEGGYFSEMVREAIGEARRAIADMPTMRKAGE